MSPALAEWVRDPALAPVWAAVRERLERNGVEPRGSVQVGGLDRAARHSVSGLLGRPVVRDHALLDLGRLDESLRERSGAGGLVAVLEALGGPVRNRRLERSTRTAEREAPFAAARAWLAQRPEVAAEAWVEPWLSELRRAGTVTRAADRPGILVRALEVVTEVRRWGDGGAGLGRNELAARVTGDAHALDDGSVLGQAVVRALALVEDEPAPTTPGGRRSLWERHGVLTDAVSSTCLVLGLRPSGDSSVARRLAFAAEAGDPVHLTGWDLGRDPLTLPHPVPVLVCENPRVLEAIARKSRTPPPRDLLVVCTSGVPGLVTVSVLERLADSGARLAYHGDFDWPGLAIANRLMARVGCVPWRMSASDYSRGVRPDGPRLVGTPVVASWDERLAEEMARQGVAVHEESQLVELLDAMDELRAYSGDALEETAALLRAPANAKRLVESLQQALDGRREVHDLAR